MPAVSPGRHAELIEQVIGRLRQINVHSDQFIARLGAAHGLHRTDLNALSHIARAEGLGSPLSAGDLAERLGVRASATTSVLDRLEAAGHIHRAPHDNDRRRTRLTLRPEAREEVESFFRPLGLEWRAVAAAFTADELDAVLRFLVAMDDALVELDEPRP